MLRPAPPEPLCEPGAEFYPAPDVAAWAHETFVVAGGTLWNPDHEHLEPAHVGYLWTNVAQVSKMVGVAGSAEIFFPRGTAWQKGRQVVQMLDWFGDIPDFIVTLSAPYAAVCDDLAWCALVEHELYHCAQAIDPKTGAPKFTKQGKPKYALREHDVTEFVGVTRRYGPGASRNVAELVEAALGIPEVAPALIEAACGTCGRLTL